MKTLDRTILITLVIGVWVLIGTLWLKPSNVDARDRDGHTHDHIYAKVDHSHSINQIRGLDSQIRLTVSQCSRGTYGDC